MRGLSLPIPYLAMYPDGICKVTEKRYSKCVVFEDINYQLAQADDKTAIFENWCDFLNYFDASVSVQLSFINQGTQREQAEKAISIPAQEDAFNSIRTEYSDMLKNQLSKGNNGLVKHKYITGEKPTEIQRAHIRQQKVAAQEQPAQEQPEQEAPQDKDTFSIFQIKGGDETRDLRFEPYDRLTATGHRVDPKNYALVYSAELTPGTSLEDIYTRFNIDHPKDFKGHSLSVSDVVVLHQNGQDTAHYVDSFGYKDVPEFFKEQEKALIPDDLETGETIKTPRGTFYVTAMSREQMEAAGYGLHHQSDDGKYLIMGNGTRAFAVPVQPENYLKAAEQTTEQNYNMIDGQINNTPTTAELEAKVKAGETISLVDLAEAVKADKERGKAAKTEKKPSIRAQLRADKEKTAQKKAAKSKNHELEV